MSVDFIKTLDLKNIVIASKNENSCVDTFFVPNTIIFKLTLVKNDPTKSDKA